MVTRIGIGGLNGRMSQAVASIAGRSAEYMVTGGVVRAESPASVAVDATCLVTADSADLIGRIDVFIDFSTPGSMPRHLEALVAGRIPYVSGVTGLSQAEERALDCASAAIPVMHATNFSIGVAVVAELVRLAAALMPEADIEIVDLHHRRKKDSPSGTALTLIEAVEDGRADKHSSKVFGRTGSGERATGEIGVHSLRGGGNPGEHQILFAAEGEEVWIGHRALSRSTFAEGALRAASWLLLQPPGRYHMRDLVSGRLVKDS